MTKLNLDNARTSVASIAQIIMIIYFKALILPACQVSIRILVSMDKENIVTSV